MAVVVFINGCGDCDGSGDGDGGSSVGGGGVVASSSPLTLECRPGVCDHSVLRR